MRLSSVPRWWAVLAVGALLALALLWAALPAAPRPAPAPAPAPGRPAALSRLLPHRYWHHRQLYPDSYADASCTRFPELGELRNAAPTWQSLTVHNVSAGHVYIYGAYWDDRFEEPLVRVLVYSDVTPLPALYCQLWFPFDNEPQLETADATYAWESSWGGPTPGVNEPYVLACRARRHSPEQQLAPLAVSLVLQPCDVAGNALNVQNAPMPESIQSATQEWALPEEVAAVSNGTSIGVCVKWLHFRSDVSARLAEWLELLRAFGAERAYLYIVRAHKNTERVLRRYEESGFAAVTRVAHPPQVSGVHWSRGVRDFLDMRRELATLNDCLYRNLRRHRWLAVIDLDEIIVPDRDGTWGALLDREASAASSEEGGAPFDALVFNNYYVIGSAQRDSLAPPPSRMLAHTWRSRTTSPPGYYVKSFVNTTSVVTMHNHTPLRCGEPPDWCRNRDVTDASVARKLHFREQCPDDDGACAAAAAEPVRDDALRRWRPAALAAVRAVLDQLGIPVH